MSKKRIQLIIVVLFSLYGIIALFVSFPFSPFLYTSIPFKTFVFPPSYRMFVKPPKVYSTLEYTFYKEGEKDSLKVDYSKKIEEILYHDFPFNANEYYYFRTLLIGAHNFDFNKNLKEYNNKYSKEEVSLRSNAREKYVDGRLSFFKESLINLSDKIRKEDTIPDQYENMIIRLKAHNIMPKYDTVYYYNNEYVYSLPKERIVIEIRK